MSEQATTPYSDRVNILADLWLNYRYDENFDDFVEYNDLGLPLAYAISNEIVDTTVLAEGFINETFELLLAGLDTEDTGFETLDELLGSVE